MTSKKVLGKVLEILGLDMPDMSTFDNRLKFQKIIYLLQSSGMSLGYGYNWYVKGPYSSPLAHDLFELEDNSEIYDEIRQKRFKNHDQIVDKLNEFKNFLGDGMNDAKYLEVLASIHYINETTFSGNGSYDELKKALLNAKPSLKTVEGIDDTISEAYKKLQEFNNIYAS